MSVENIILDYLKFLEEVDPKAAGLRKAVRDWDEYVYRDSENPSAWDERTWKTWQKMGYNF